MRKFLLGAALLLASTLHALAGDPDPAKWDDVLAEAQGETVYFNAWGGAENINAYLEWAGGELEKRYGVKLVHVKLDDTANAVAKVVAEKAAGRNEGGTVDLIWINGENFASMKRQQLLFSPGWAEKLPNWKFVDIEDKPTIRTDFTIPVEGLESPWGMAKLVFFHDSAKTDAGLDAEIGEGTARLGEEEPRPLHLSAAAGFHRLVVPEAGAVRTGRRSRRASEAGRRGVVRERRRRRSSPISTSSTRCSGAAARPFRRTIRR